MTRTYLEVVAKGFYLLLYSEVFRTLSLSLLDFNEGQKKLEACVIY